MPEGPKPEAQRSESGLGPLERGKPAPSPSAVGLGECCKLPQPPAAKRFSCIPEAPDGLSWNFLRVSSGGMAPLAPFNPSVVKRNRTDWCGSNEPCIGLVHVDAMNDVR